MTNSGLFGNSFRQVGLPIDGRETDGLGHHPFDLHCPDLCIILLRLGRQPMLSLQEAQVEFRRGDGGMCTPSRDDWFQSRWLSRRLTMYTVLIPHSDRSLAIPIRSRSP